MQFATPVPGLSRDLAPSNQEAPDQVWGATMTLPGRLHNG